MRDLGAVRDHHVVEEVPVIRLVDLRGALHGLGGEADLVADQLGATRDLALGHFGGDGIGVLDGDVRPGLGQLDRLFALLFRAHENVGGFLVVGVGQHDCVPLIVSRVVSCAAAIEGGPRRRHAAPIVDAAARSVVRLDVDQRAVRISELKAA